MPKLPKKIELQVQEIIKGIKNKQPILIYSINRAGQATIRKEVVRRLEKEGYDHISINRWIKSIRMIQEMNKPSQIHFQEFYNDHHDLPPYEDIKRIKDTNNPMPKTRVKTVYLIKAYGDLVGQNTITGQYVRVRTGDLNGGDISLLHFTNLNETKKVIYKLWKTKEFKHAHLIKLQV